jgi:hypothetical protein
LFVADSMTGQDAVNQALGFRRQARSERNYLTKLDGDSRGGAAVDPRDGRQADLCSLVSAKKLDALEPFYPDRLASRILGMGDVLSLIDKVQQNVEQKEAERLQQAFQKQQFTLEEFSAAAPTNQKAWDYGRPAGDDSWRKKLASQVDAGESRERIETGRSDHQLDDDSRAAQSGAAECGRAEAHRPTAAAPRSTMSIA